MACWACRIAIVAAVIILLAILAKVAVVTAAVANAVQAIILAAELAGLTLTPLSVGFIAGGLGGLSLAAALDWLCCKMGGWCC